MATQTGSFDFKAAKLAKDSAEATASADATAKANQAEANAKKVATNFLSQDSSGVMVYDGSSGTQTPSSPSAGTKNVLIDSNGMYVRNGSTNLASFTGSSAQIGQDSAAHSVVDANGMRIYASDGSTQIANLGYGEGTAESGTAIAPYYTFGTRVSSVAIGTYSVVEGESNEAPAPCAHAEGKNTEASGAYSHAEGYNTSAYGYSSHAEGVQTEANHYSHAEGVNTNASGIRGCHAEGQQTESSGEASHSEGYQTIASAFSAHAEGNGAEASGTNSHAEGTNTVASGASSHAEGDFTQANGEYSHAQNAGTIANGDYQTALGHHNVADATSAVIIGNGTSATRSNALTVDWNGNINIASGAKYKINGNNLSASDIANSVTGVKGNAESSYRTGNVNITPANIGAVPTSRTVNSKALSANITLSASDVGALPLSGGTMTGQIKTSFKESVAMGSYGAAATTVDGLVTELRYSSGCMGSANIGTAYTKDGITIGTGWYNFIYSPHRSGGANGAASGDNCNYGNLVLMGMTVSGSYLIRVSSATISEVRGLANYGDTAWKTLETNFNYIKRDGVVYVDFYKTNQSLSTSWTTIGTLPSGYRPNHNLYGAAMTLTTTPIAYFINSSSGAVQMRTATGSGSYVTAFSVSYPVL